MTNHTLVAPESGLSVGYFLEPLWDLPVGDSHEGIVALTPSKRDNPEQYHAVYVREYIVQGQLFFIRLYEYTGSFRWSLTS